MPYKDPEKQKEAQHRSYLKNKDKFVKRRKDTRIKWRDFVNEQKDRECMDCGVKYPYYVMEFDHRNGDEKVDNISRLIRYGTLKQIEVEIKKCDVVCANCHRARTYYRAIALQQTSYLAL